MVCSMTHIAQTSYPGFLRADWHVSESDQENPRQTTEIREFCSLKFQVHFNFSILWSV